MREFICFVARKFGLEFVNDKVVGRCPVFGRKNERMSQVNGFLIYSRNMKDILDGILSVDVNSFAK